MRDNGLFVLFLAVIIVTLGVLSIYSSNYQKEGGPWADIYKRQVIWALIGFVFFIIMSNFNYRRLWDATYILYILAVLLLAAVFLLGIVRLGAQRWIRLSWFNFQPSEVVKLIIVIFLARYFSLKSTDSVFLSTGRLGIVRGFIVPFVFVAVPMLLIIEQPDLGSALMLLFIFIVMLFLAGVRMRYFMGSVILGMAIAPLFWHMLRDYQKDRLMVFLNPNIDPLGAGYTIIQSKIAIGSGGMFGKGWLSGTQSQLHFLPESHTDFIFATFAEEWGFLGCVVLLAMYFLLLKKGVGIASRTNDRFGKLLAWGISFMLGIQILINLAMNMGLAPVVGIPLPLMSYGGSSMVVTFIALGILVNIDRRRSVF